MKSILVFLLLLVWWVLFPIIFLISLSTAFDYWVDVNDTLLKSLL